MHPTVFITGADRGLGLSLAKVFAQSGWRVFAGVYQSAAYLQALDLPDDALITVPLDVTQMPSVRAAAQAVTAHTPALDVLINVAGIHLGDKDPLEQTDLEDGRLQATYEVNALGPLRVTQQFLPLLRQGARKQIVNITSEAGSIGDSTRVGWYAYCMSKAALNMQGKLLANDLVPQGFHILLLHPGWMQTDMGGSDADIPADVAARAIFDLILARDDGPMYRDYLNHPLPW